jgi:polysaccharide export outer membrane protein
MIQRLGTLMLLLILLSRMPAAPQSTAAYILGPDDVLDISVANHTDLNRVVTILPDGKIGFPEVGEVRAAGRTALELAKVLEESLQKTRNRAYVTVSVKEIHSRRVRIVGAVRIPGAYDLKPGWRIVDLTAVAGGISGRPSRVVGKIVRNGGEIVPLKIHEAMSKPDSPANVPLQADDLVLLEELDPQSNRVFVLGQAGKPGPYDLGDDGLTIPALVAQAGGTLPTAALAKVHVLRGSTEIRFNLRPLLVEGRSDPRIDQFKLQAGDVLFIPENENRFAVMGQVTRPGYMPIPEGRAIGIMEAIALAGGHLPQADLQKVSVVRNVNGRPTLLKAELNQFFTKGQNAPTFTLLPDDVVFVPMKGMRQPIGVNEILAPLNVLAIMGFRLFR